MRGAGNNNRPVNGSRAPGDGGKPAAPVGAGRGPPRAAQGARGGNVVGRTPAGQPASGPGRPSWVAPAIGAGPAAPRRGSEAEAKGPAALPAGGRRAPGASGAAGELKLRRGKEEWALGGKHLSIGRQAENDIRLTDDPEASRKHCVISDGAVRDLGSFNGTFLNEAKLDPARPERLKAGDSLRVGTSAFAVESGAPAEDLLRQTKRFPLLSTLERDAAASEARRLERLTVEELMEEEFAKIVGHEAVKRQLRRFHKKVQLDKVRDENRRLKDRRGLYHMIFTGPPGTGKTSMANLVARVLLKMQLLASQKVVFVDNALELLAGFAGQTPGRVDAKVEEARGGVLFVDEAYSIVKSEGGGQRDSFGREAIETLMKHLDPPSCVFIFAGYAEPMEAFLRVNDGLARRIPFRYHFEAYSLEQLLQILKLMAESKGEALAPEVLEQEKLPALLAALDPAARASQNAGLVSNFLSFAQIERDKRIDLGEAARNPSLACTLEWRDFSAALPALMATFREEKKAAASGVAGPAAAAVSAAAAKMP